MVLRGLGGQGKTQVALEFCRQCSQMYKESFDAIIWVDASSEALVAARFQELADYLGPIERVPKDSDRKVAYAKEAIAKLQRGWLMVFDNYDDLDGFPTIQDYIPDSPHGAVLFTSRHADTMNLVADPEV